MELLTAVAIGIVLMGLLIPATRGVYRKSLQMKCLSNIRNYGTALLAYAGDHDGLPDRRPDIFGPGDYGINYTALMSPTYLNVKRRSGNWGMNCPLATLTDQKASYGVEYGGNLSLSRYYPKLKGIPVPASRVVFAAEVYYPYFYDNVHFNSTIWGGGADESSREGFETKEGKVRTPQYHGSSNRRGLHFFFLDGHVELVYPVGRQWQNEPTSGSATNGGYFYDQRHFNKMTKGDLHVP